MRDRVGILAEDVIHEYLNDLIEDFLVGIHFLPDQSHVMSLIAPLHYMEDSGQVGHEEDSHPDVLIEN